MRHILFTSLVFLSALLAGGAQADANTIKAYIDAQLPDNTSGAIGPSNLTSSFDYFIDNLNTIPVTGAISTTYDVTSTGTIKGARFIGDGSGLTNLPSSTTILSGTTASITLADITTMRGVSVSAVNVSATYFTGNANGLTINPVSSSMSVGLLSMFGPEIQVANQVPIICDGQVHPENIQLFQDVAYMNGGTKPLNISLPAGQTCVWGTDAPVGAVTYMRVLNGGSNYTNPTLSITGNGCTGQVVSRTVVSGTITAVSISTIGSGCNQENPAVTISDSTGTGAVVQATIDHPLYLVSNTVLNKRSFNRHNINGPELFWLTTKFNTSAYNVNTQKNVWTVGYPGVYDDTVSRTLSQSRKMEGIANCTDCGMINPTVSLTTDPGNFCIQSRNTANITIANPTCKMIAPPGASVSRDGIHFTENAFGGSIYNAFIRAVDDSLSFTDEGSAMIGDQQYGVHVYGGDYRSYAHGGLKIFTDSGAVGAGIDGPHLHDVLIGNWGSGGQGNCGKIEQGLGTTIRNTTFDGVTCDGTYAEGLTGSGTSLFSILAESDCGVADVDLGNFSMFNIPYRGLERDQGACRVRSNGMTMGPYIGQSTISSATVTGMNISGTGVVKISVNNGSALTSVCTTGICWARVSGMGYDFNNSTFAVTAVSITGNYVLATAANVSTSTTEVSASGLVTFVSRTGVSLYDRGSYASVDKNLTMIDPATIGVQYTTGNGATYAVSASTFNTDGSAKLIISTTTAGSLNSLKTEKPASGYATVTGLLNTSNNVIVGKIVEVSTSANPPYIIIRQPNRTSATDEFNMAAISSVTTIYIPTENMLINPQFTRQNQSNGLQINAGMNTVINGLTCLDFAGNICAGESNSANVSGTVFVNGLDIGVPLKTRQSWNLTDPQYAMKMNNFGTNSMYMEFVPQSVVSTSQVRAVSGSYTGLVQVGRVSATDNTSQSQFFGVSATAVSSTGNISAAKFVGDGSLLTGITASAAPAGLAGQIQYNFDGTSTSGTAAISYNSTTNVLTAGTISSTGLISNVVSSSTGADLTVTWDTNDTTVYNKASNRWEWKVGGTERYRQSGSAYNLSGVNLAIGSTIFSPSTELEVRGTISTTNVSATGAIQVPSSTTSVCSTAGGLLRYNTTSDTLQVCTSTGWKSLSVTP